MRKWNIKQNIKWINFDDYANENKTEHNSNGPYIPAHPYRILIIGGSKSRKTNAWLNLIENQPDIDKKYLYAKDPYEAKYQSFINILGKVDLKRFNYPKSFIEYSNDMQYVYKNIDEYNIDKERKILTFFDDMIADMINSKKLNSVVTKLFIRDKKLNITFAFIIRYYLKVSKDIRLNTTQFCITKIPNKGELQQIALNHSSDISTKDLINIYKKCTDKQYFF